MRYFETTNASLPLKTGRFSFEFEPIELFGGAWRGILKTDDPEAGETLAAHKGPVTEVTAEQFEELKKKWLKVEIKAKVSPSSSAEALALHQRSQGVTPAEQGNPSRPTSSASTVGKLELAEVRIVDDLAPHSERQESPAPEKKDPDPEPPELLEI